MNLLEALVALQTSIHHAITADIAAFAATGDAAVLLMAWPIAVGFGAVHALTPGHNKLVLALYTVGERPSRLRAVATSMLMSAAHIGSAVVVALAAGWLVSRTITSAGQAPVLENTSRIVMLAIGAYMILRATRVVPHMQGHGIVFALGVGLIPCPLTLFVMVYAVAVGVPVAGLLFACAMLAGVGGILCLVALTASMSAGLLERHAGLANWGARVLEAVVGGALVAFAVVLLF